ncbi:Os01g0619050 [Oryza sativa Japonica Group]|uniref:Os01g0619050 protein n=1 Tax=Oryza sativa subsp. japonica TaxID=39947 RepID=A0A0P0V5C8_ORYSJ|nr:Os01g0619050 [Oryza sativa Japonica Group]
MSPVTGRGASGDLVPGSIFSGGGGGLVTGGGGGGDCETDVTNVLGGPHGFSRDAALHEPLDRRHVIASPPGPSGPNPAREGPLKLVRNSWA